MKRHLRPFGVLALIVWVCTRALLLADTPPAAEVEAAVDKQPTEKEKSGQATVEAPARSIEEALQKLQLPGIKINTEVWSVDVDATVAIDGGLLELIACIKDSKEHESVVAVNAKPSHIHTALLLLGAEPGNPAMRKVIGEGEDARFVDLPPKGAPIGVYLVIDTPEGKKEVPINQFIAKAPEDYFQKQPGGEEEEKEPELYPDHVFIFTGSVLVDRGEEAPRQYIADYSGNLITLSTFGDEVLGTLEIHEHANEHLMWTVLANKLPAIDTPLTLRLKPLHRSNPGHADDAAAEDK